MPSIAEGWDVARIGLLVIFLGGTLIVQWLPAMAMLG